MDSEKKVCEKCGYEYHYSLERCPHCAYPGNYSNVYAASRAAERDQVDDRYRGALQTADGTGARASLDAFATWIDGSSAVICRSLEAIENLARTDLTSYATYYQLREAGLILPDGANWEVLRGMADAALFPGYADKIRFGALSGDGVGVLNYGDFSLVLKEPLITARSTVFDQNSAAFLAEHKPKDALAALPGRRAPWAERKRLVIAQLGEQVKSDTTVDAYSGILLAHGASTDSDRFIEVQIWGSLTVRTIEKVVYVENKASPKVAGSRLRQLERHLARFDTPLEVRR